MQMLLNQIHLPDLQQARCWGSKVCSREGVYSWGSWTRRWEQICLLEARGLGYLWMKRLWGGRDRARWMEAGQGQGNGCSAQEPLSYQLFHGIYVQKMVVLAWCEDGVFDPLKSKGHSSDTWAGPVLRWVVPTSVDQLQITRRSWLQNPGKQLKQTSYCFGDMSLGGHASGKKIVKAG